MGTQHSWDAARAVAEREFAEARADATMRKQAAMALAMKLPMPAHLIAVRAAEKTYHLALAEAADATDGIINPAPFRNAAAA